jgi:apolipoprotein N-acyltransferase
LLTSAFPKIGIAGFAWVAPGILVAAGLGKTGGEIFRIGYVGGLAHYLTMLYWLLLIPYRWHGLPLGPAFGWFALSAFLSLFPALWVWLVCPREVTSSLGREDSEGVQGGVLARNWARRAGWGLLAAAAWVAWEMVLARILGGFPWDLLGVSQFRLSPLIQIASVTGVYGVSFLVAWVSLALLSAALLMIRRPTSRSVFLGEVFLPLLTVAILFNMGFRQLRSEAEPSRMLKVTLVQPSIPQTLIWDDSNDAQRFHQLLQLSEQGLTNQTDLLIWPEAAVPKMLRYDHETFEAVTNLAQRHRVWMIIGSDDAESRPNASSSDEADYFNSSFLINPDARLVGRYIKRNLVMFGEYIPFRHWLPFLKYLTPIQSGFTPGSRSETFVLNQLGVKTQVLICFEDVFPHLARTEVESDTDFLVNLTNDGWFDNSAAQWQQAATALFRAVENHIPLLRCSNNGLTCWVDACGRFRQIFSDEHGSVYGAGTLAARIPLLGADQRRTLTFYTRHGDWFGWSCVGIASAWLIGKLLRRGGRLQVNLP